MAKGKNTVELVTKLAQPVADEMGLVLWDVRFEKEGASWYLRLFIDKPEGVDILNCESFSHAIDKLLDAADPIEQSYFLE
ncbi:MAG: ribosome maturation factor RimP, partial [Hydrogenoanaerobacterium sp.]